MQLRFFFYVKTLLNNAFNVNNHNIFFKMINEEVIPTHNQGSITFGTQGISQQLRDLLRLLESFCIRFSVRRTIYIFACPEIKHLHGRWRQLPRIRLIGKNRMFSCELTGRLSVESQKGVNAAQLFKDVPLRTRRALLSRLCIGIAPIWF